MIVRLEGRHSGPENMERDLALLDEAEKGTVGARVYGWDGAWVSLGRFQDPELAIRLGAPVQTVIRPTGGRAVLHGHDVTLGLAVPIATLQASVRDVRKVYRNLALPLIAALATCEVPAALGEETEFADRTPRSADCFSHVSRNDIVDRTTGRKVCGCALRVTHSAALVQASIPAAEPLVDPRLVYAVPGENRWVNLDPERFAEALAGALAKIG